MSSSWSLQICAALLQRVAQSSRLSFLICWYWVESIELHLPVSVCMSDFSKIFPLQHPDPSVCLTKRKELSVSLSVVNLILSFCEVNCSRKSSVSVLSIIQMTSSTNLNNFSLRSYSKGTFGETVQFMIIVRAEELEILRRSEIEKGGAVANRLRRRTSDQTVLGSNPAVAAALSPWTRLFTPIVPRRSLHISFH